jgi:hypothetical protein
MRANKTPGSCDSGRYDWRMFVAHHESMQDLGEAAACTFQKPDEGGDAP